MAKSGIRDLTVGKPTTVLWRFCLPLFGSVIFQQLYNIADSVIAGRFVGENALAAIGNSYEITLIYLALSFGCNVGCSILVSYFYGSKEYAQLKTTISTACIAAGAICVIALCAGLPGGSAMLRMIRTPENIFADSRTYLLIYTAGFPFVMFYNIATGIFSALGDSKTPFIFLAFSSVANVVMDIVFVAVFDKGVAGVALATVICQGISCFLSLKVVSGRLRGIGNGEKGALFSGEILKRLAKVAVPSMLQQGFISVGNIILQGVINGFGAGVIAGYSAAVKLNNLIITSFTTIGNGVSNYTSQNMGAGKTDRVRMGLPAGNKMMWAICIPTVLLYQLAGGALVRLFMDAPTAAAMDTGILFLRILSPFYFIISVKLVADGILRGAQRMNFFMISTFTDLALRVALAMVLSRTALGSAGIWAAWPVGWTISTGMSLFFCSRVWKNREVEHA